MTDAQLQARAGKNYVDFLKFHRVSERATKLTVKSLTILENPKNEPIVISDFVNNGVCVLLNRTGFNVNAELYIEDADGNRVFIDGTSMADTDDGEMQAPIIYLNAGEKLVLEITSGDSILGGEGLWMVVNTTNPAAPIGELADRKHTRITGTTFELSKRPGVLPVFGGYLPTILNYSDDALTVDFVAVTPDGDVTLQSGVSVNANDYQQLDPPLINTSDVISHKLVFSSLPTKPVVVCEEYIIPANRYDQE